MSQRQSKPSSDEFRDDLDYDQLRRENELATERARQRLAREGGQQRGLSQRMSEQEAPLSARVGRSPNQSPYVTPNSLRQALESAGVPSVPAGVGVAPNLSSPSSGVPRVKTIRAAARTLPTPPFSPQQIDVVERIARGEVPAVQIDALLEEVGLVY